MPCFKVFDHLRLVLVLAVGLAFLLSGCGEEKAAPATAQATKVVVVGVKTLEIPQLASFSAVLSAKEAVEVRARVSGYLAERLFEEGALVKAGQVLYKLDDRDLKAALETATANTAKAKAAWDNAEANRSRMLTLAGKGAISLAQRDTAVATADEAMAAYKAAQSQEEKASIDLSYATIIAPTTGYIGRSNIEVGGSVDVGNATLLTTIYNIDPILADFSISDKQYAGSRRAQAQDLAFTLTLGDDRKPYPYPGVMDMADPVINNKTNTLGVRVAFPNPDHFLRPGMYANVTIKIGDQEVMVVPEVAIMDQGNAKAVYTVGEGDTLAISPVTVGRLLGEDREVLKGLTNGQQVVVEGLVTARPGLKVAPELKAEPAPKAGEPASASDAK